MAHVVAVSNLKGGTGKSTIAVNLACARATSKRRVVLIDADAQGTASQRAAQGALPIQVEALPLEQQRDAERWVTGVVALRDATDLVVIPVTASGAVTAINLPAGVLELLRMVAIKRAARAGKGRPSVSAVIADLVEKNRQELETEIQQCKALIIHSITINLRFRSPKRPWRRGEP